MSGFPDEIMVQKELTPQIPILPKPFPPERLLAAIEDVLADPQSGGVSPRLTLSLKFDPKTIKEV